MPRPKGQKAAAKKRRRNVCGSFTVETGSVEDDEVEEFDPIVGEDDDDEIQNRIEDVALLEEMDLADGPEVENYERELAQGWTFLKKSGEEPLVRRGQSERNIRHRKQKGRESKQAAQGAARIDSFFVRAIGGETSTDDGLISDDEELEDKVFGVNSKYDDGDRAA